MDLKTGTKVKISNGSGIDSGKTGTLVDNKLVKLNGRGIPELPGHYKPIDWKQEYAIKLDGKGELITMFKNRVSPLNEVKSHVKQEIKKELKRLGINVVGNFVRKKDITSFLKTVANYEDQILKAYFIAMLWSTMDNSDEQGGDPLEDNYGVEDIAKEAVAESKKDIEKFLKLAEEKGVELTKYDTEQIGHDIWLTRAGHGAGFWDGDYDDDDGEILTEISKILGNKDPYVGDDGLIYIG